MNRVLLQAKIERTATNEIKISFAREGHGDDIVDAWADRLKLAMDFAIVQAKEAAAAGAKPNEGASLTDSPVSDGKLTASPTDDDHGFEHDDRD